MLINIVPGAGKTYVGDMGLDWIEVEEGGFVYKYRIKYKNNKEVGFKFVDEEPDEYNCSSF